MLEREMLADRQGLAWKVQEIAGQVLRTDLAQPGFAHLDAGDFWTPSEFRTLLVALGQELSACSEGMFSRPLLFLSLGRFDQQVTTEAHRDGAPDESLLLLGYEPTSVGSRLFLLDYTRCAVDRGLTPQEFLERFNPLYSPGKEFLRAYTTELTEFRRDHYQVVLINNSCQPWEERGKGMLGVLHQAVMEERGKGQPRWVNSLVLAPEGAGQVARITEDDLRLFIEDARPVVAL